MLLDVQDGAVAVLDELVHLDGLLVAVAVVQPAVVDARDDIFAALDELAGEAAHDVLGVGGPAAAVDDHHAGEFLRPVGDEDVILQGLDARLRIDDVLDGLVALQALRLDDGGADAHDVVVHLDGEFGDHRFLVGGIEHAAGDGELVAAVEGPARVGDIDLHVQDGAGGNHAVLGDGGGDGDLAVLRLFHPDAEGVLRAERSAGKGQEGEGKEDAFHIDGFVVPLFPLS